MTAPIAPAIESEQDAPCVATSVEDECRHALLVKIDEYASKGYTPSTLVTCSTPTTALKAVIAELRDQTIWSTFDRATANFQVLIEEAEQKLSLLKEVRARTSDALLAGSILMIINAHAGCKHPVTSVLRRALDELLALDDPHAAVAKLRTVQNKNSAIIAKLKNFTFKKILLFAFPQVLLQYPQAHVLRCLPTTMSSSASESASSSPAQLESSLPASTRRQASLEQLATVPVDEPFRTHDDLLRSPLCPIHAPIQNHQGTESVTACGLITCEDCGVTSPSVICPFPALVDGAHALEATEPAVLEVATYVATSGYTLSAFEYAVNSVSSWTLIPLGFRRPEMVAVMREMATKFGCPVCKPLEYFSVRRDIAMALIAAGDCVEATTLLSSLLQITAAHSGKRKRLASVEAVLDNVNSLIRAAEKKSLFPV